MKQFHLFLSKMPNRAMAEAISRCYRALFEGLTPQQKARRTIRAILPPPPDGWDSPARREDGSEFVSEHGTTLSWDQVLETYLRGLIFRDKAIAPKFEPGVARIAFGELGVWPDDIEDYRPSKPESVPLGQFRAILHMLSGDAHVNEYDFDLNGMKYGEMVERFGKSSADADADDTEDTGHLNYRIVHIPDFETAKEYAGYVNHWCVCEYRSYFKRYTARGKNTFYMLFANGFEDIPDTKGENYPKDLYGLSVIGPMIGPDGSVEYCCVRRNHEGGMGDHALTEKEISQLLGRPVRTVLPHIESESTQSAGGRYAAMLAKGMKPEEIFDDSHRVVIWDGEYAICRLASGGGDLLMDLRTMRPVTETDIEDYKLVDDRVCRISLVTDTDDYGDDIIVNYLLTRNGNLVALAAADMDAYGETDAIYCDSLEGVYTTTLPGVYQIALDTGDIRYNTLIYVSDDDNIRGLTMGHSEITVYAADGLIVCDPDSDTLDDGDDYCCLEILKWLGNGETEELVGNGTMRHVPDHMFVYDGALPGGKVNILYTTDRGVCLIHDGNAVELDMDVEDAGYINENTMPSLVWLEHEYKEDYSVFSMKECRMVAEKLPDYPDDEGVYELPDGRKNVVTERGILLKEPAISVDPIGYLRTPIAKLLGKANAGNHAYYIGITMPDGERFVDTETGESLYDRPVPDGSYPYTDRLYVGKVYEDGNEGRALFTLDGKQTSCTFDSLSANPLIMERKNALKDNKTGYNLIDTASGKELFPYWLSSLPQAMIGEMNADNVNAGLWRCQRETDGKTTLVMLKTPARDNGDGKYILDGIGHFEPTDIGWHDHFEQMPGCPLTVMVHDSTTGEWPTDKTNYRTFIYDFKTGKKSRPYPGRRLLATLRELCLEHGEYFSSTGFTHAVAKCPDWMEWIDSHIDTAAKWRED